MLVLIRQWWLARVDQPWVVEFMQSRGLIKVLQTLVGLCGAGLGAIAALSAISSAGPHGAAGRAISGSIALGGLGWALRWALGDWPSQRLSLAMVVLADGAVAVGCLLDSNALAALTGTALFALPGAYVAFFHGPRVQAAHVAWCVVWIAGLAARLAVSADGDLPLAIAKALIAMIVVVGILPALQFGFWLVSTDAVDSLSDPLTGVLNRRGLEHHFAQMMASGRSRHGEDALCTIAVDLDKFKAVNDTWGHSSGDEVLVRTAERIRGTVRGAALIARTGGEEFVIIDVLPLESVRSVAERLRVALTEAIDEISVTASIGAVVHHMRRVASVPDLDRLMAEADEAMYTSKRAGGDLVTVALPDDDRQAGR